MLTNIRKLYLIHNRITKIENISPLVNITVLELGSNRIRVSIASNGSSLSKVNLRNQRHKKGLS